MRTVPSFARFAKAFFGATASGCDGRRDDGALARALWAEGRDTLDIAAALELHESCVVRLLGRGALAPPPVFDRPSRLAARVAS